MTESRLRLLFPAVERGRKSILDAGQLDLPRGGNVAVAGLNGAGKSTLFLYLVGAIRSTPREDSLSSGIAFLPQECPVPSSMTVVEFGTIVHGLSAERTEECLEMAGLASSPRRRTTRLSGGEKQFMSLCFTMAQSAELTLLDEPTASLDMMRRTNALGLIRGRRWLPTHGTLLIASQIPQVLATTCQHLVALKDGKCVFDGRLSELAKPDDEEIERLLLSIIA